MHGLSQVNAGRDHLLERVAVGGRRKDRDLGAKIGWRHVNAQGCCCSGIHSVPCMVLDGFDSALADQHHMHWSSSCTRPDLLVWESAAVSNPMSGRSSQTMGDRAADARDSEEGGGAKQSATMDDYDCTVENEELVQIEDMLEVWPCLQARRHGVWAWATGWMSWRSLVFCCPHLLLSPVDTWLGIMRQFGDYLRLSILSSAHLTRQ